MYSIGVIGDYDSICGFSAVGFRVFPVETGEQAKVALHTLADEGYGIIYVTEPFLEGLRPEYTRYDDQTTPCIIPIPASIGGTGFGESRLRDYVERAVGSDIIFKTDETE